MLFSSLNFLFIFLPLVIVAYYLMGRRLRNVILLLFSLFFYAYGEPKYILIMILSIFANYIFGLLVDRFRNSSFKAKLFVGTSVIVNIGILGYYKYADFLIENINGIFGTKILSLDVIMPIGISFFTFQGMSYVIDIYRGNGTLQRNPINVALYISFFPQLIAGPIVRYETVSEQIKSREETIEKFSFGIKRFILGLSKKILIANNMGIIADDVFSKASPELTLTLSWIGAIAYTLQIYFDFSGYSDMAIGLGRIFGFRFLENFNYPYISQSITEFWRRWHISLGTWFRDYVYIPLGGNRVGVLKHLRNILIVWFLTGLWHGASWNFIFWGLYFGFILTFEKYFLLKRFKKVKSPIKHIYSLILIVIGWVFFRAETLTFALNYIGVMFGLSDNPISSGESIYYINQYKLEFIIGFICSAPTIRRLKTKIESVNVKRLEQSVELVFKPFILASLFLFCIMYLVNSTFNPFIYFRF